MKRPVEPIAPDHQALVVARVQQELWILVVARFRELEAETGLRQVDLAKQLGVSRPQIHEWLSEPHNMTIKAAGRLMEAMGAQLVFDMRRMRREPRRRVRSRSGARNLTLAIFAAASAAVEFGPVSQLW